MSEIASLISRVVNYLREIDVFSGNPVFEKSSNELVCVDPRGEWDEYYMQPPFWQQRDLEFHKTQFDAIDSQLKQLSNFDVQTQALEEIPDSSNTVIIELGSEFGERGAGYLAKYKPDSKVILLDKGFGKDRKFDYLFIEPQPDAKIKRVVFTNGRHLLKEEDIEKKVNGLYKANGVHNLTFYQHELTLEEIEGKLPHFLRDIKGKDIYLFGYESPLRLPFLIGKLYQNLNARFMSVSLTAQEKTKPDEFIWSVIQRNLGLTDAELKGFVESVHDPESASVNGSLSEKYDYKIVAQKRVGVMIKLGIALALAKEVDGQVFRAKDNDMHFNNYNKEDHYVQARKN